MNRCSLYAFGLGLVALLGSSGARACFCSGGSVTLAQEYHRSAHIFLGTVVEMRHGNGVAVRFRVDEAFKGVVSDPAHLVVGEADSCSPRFQLGQQYLVFAGLLQPGWRKALDIRIEIPAPFGPVLSTTSCSWTVRADRALGELTLLRGHARDDPKPAIYGHVGEYRVLRRGSFPSPVAALADVKVVVTRGEERFEARTNAAGVFVLPDLPLGRYEISVELPASHRRLQSYGGPSSAILDSNESSQQIVVWATRDPPDADD